MGSRSLSDFHVLLSVGMLPLAACDIDVGDGLSIGSQPDTADSDAQATETTDGPSGDSGSPASEASDADPAESASTTGVDSSEDVDSGAPATGPVTGVDTGGGGYDGGMYAEICTAWGMHAEACGLDGDAIGYCEYDLAYAMYLGPDCPAAIEDFYSCLVAADCAELNDPDAQPCSDAAVAEACA